jgi:hypothetical protein
VEDKLLLRTAAVLPFIESSALSGAAELVALWSAVGVAGGGLAAAEAPTARERR